MAATGAVRAARRAGSTAAATVTSVPTGRLMSTVADVSGRLVPMSTPSAHLMPAFAPWAISTPSAIPRAEPNTPTMAASPSTDASHLAPRGPERAQQRQLTGSLSDEHREGVDDDERADEQGDAGEDQEEGGEEPEALLDRFLIVCFHVGAGDGLG